MTRTREWRSRAVTTHGWLAAVAVTLLLGTEAIPGEAPPLPRFRHEAHRGQVKCVACHAGATKSAAAGMPRVADCLDCHEGAQAKTPEGRQEEAKLEALARAAPEYAWPRPARLAAHAFFSHRRHVALAKLECAACHPGVAGAAAAPRAATGRFSMAWCMACHAERRASADCLACHR